MVWDTTRSRGGCGAVGDPPIAEGERRVTMGHFAHRDRTPRAGAWCSVAPVALRTVIVLLVVAGASAGEIIRVPDDFATIQAGINAAQDGDEVVVSPGTYFENINFVGKDITVRSVAPLDPFVVQWTVIDGRALNSVVTM
ncbi:MAG: hypothetical protein IID43_05395, partial [Planctomycetes bacterium]|nr:hypothetical protein [Planctomycetota bacterium]